MEWLGPLVVGGQSLARVRVHFMAGATRSSRDVYLVQDSSGDSMGEWKIDFDSFAKSQQPDFKPQQEEKLNKP